MKNNKKHLIMSFIKSFILIGLVISSIFIMKTCYSGYNLYKEVTSEISIDDKVNEIRSKENYVESENIPGYFLDAIVSVEDHRFYDHLGIDIISIARAAVSNVINGEIVSGGSTITQQLSKNMFFSFEKKYTRKIAEVIVAFQLEEKLSKEEILEMYVNVIYYGDGNYGINEAANNYYNIEAKELTLEQSVIIAGLPQAPSIYTINKEDKRTKKRTEQVISAMVIANYLSEEKADKVYNDIIYSFEL